MAVYKTSDAKNNYENLADTISNVNQTDTPVISQIGKETAGGMYNENLIDQLRPANKDNASAEGAEAPDATLVSPTRVGNFTQIFSATVAVSGTQRKVKTAGTSDELLRQLVKAGLEIKLDQEASVVSANGSQAGNTRKSAGMQSWIETNASHGVGGSTAGYTNGIVPAPVGGTDRELTKKMLADMCDGIWKKSGKRKLQLLASTEVVSLIRGLRDGAGHTIQVPANENTLYDAVDYYESQHGLVPIISHRDVDNVIIAYDPALWAWATLRKFEKTELGKTGDSTKYLLTTEGTLVSKNESGNGKIADILI